MESSSSAIPIEINITNRNAAIIHKSEDLSVISISFEPTELNFLKSIMKKQTLLI